MKKTILSLALLATTASVYAQAVEDSVSIGAGYVNQVWYDMSNDEQGTKPLAEWDFAFDLKNIQSGIQINTANGVKIWGYPKDELSGWASVDTNGLSTWSQRYNSVKSWALGAIGNYADKNDATDLDWGKYDPSTHIVTGDSLFILQLANGDYKKFAVEQLKGGTFYVKYANLDGSSEKSVQIKKGDFTGKSLAYYSIKDDKQVNRAPDADDWDLLFTKYTDFVPSPYGVTGVLAGRGVEIEQVENVADVKTFNQYGTTTRSEDINIIGSDWKKFNMGTMGYDIQDSVVYIVYTVSGDIWKMYFTGFTRSTGTMKFTKERLVAASVYNVNNEEVGKMSVFPNPTQNSGYVTVAYHLSNNNNNAQVLVFNMNGQVVKNETVDNTTGLHQHQIQTSGLASGTYMISIVTDNGKATQQLIIQ